MAKYISQQKRSISFETKFPNSCLTVLKKLLRHPVIDQHQVNGLHVTLLVITQC